MITDATRAKIAMQIPVTNQKTKSIRPACLLADWGSQGISNATVTAPAPHTTPIATSWTIDPLRTASETTRRRGQPAEGSEAARNACNERGSGFAEAGTPGSQSKEVSWDLESASCSLPPGRS